MNINSIINRTSFQTIVILLACICLTVVTTGHAKKRIKRKYTGVVIKKVEPPLAKKDTLHEITNKTTDTFPAPEKVPVWAWEGKKFILLEKTKMFQSFGYELYTSPKFSTDPTPPNNCIEHKNHRLKYAVFCGTTITAEKVDKKDGKEYVVTFVTDTLGLTVYGKTGAGVIEGIALFSDRDDAKKRWLGKTIYSCRRSIETFDSVASCFTSIKVSVTEPLKVIDIRWGITPLPPKSLWLIIERRNGAKGFIPLNYSWTNVLPTEITTRYPWEKDIFEKNPHELYSWETYIWETIDKHNICAGMTTGQVRFSWGEPQELRNEKGPKGETVDTYVYNGKKLTFVNDTLRSTTEE